MIIENNKQRQMKKEINTQKKERVFLYHNYDIEINDLYEELKKKFGKEHKIIDRYINMVLSSSEIPEEYKDKRFIINAEMYIYDLFLAYKLIASKKYRIPLILNYHLETHPKSIDKNFILKTIEMTVLKILEDFYFPDIKTKKLIKTITKWIYSKQKDTDYYNIIPKNEKEEVIYNVFEYYYNLHYKNEMNYLSSNGILPENILNSFFTKNKNTTGHYLRWNSNIKELSYIIFYLLLLKNINKKSIFSKEELINLITETVKDKKNNEIDENTINKYFRNFNTNLNLKNGDLSPGIRNHEEHLYKLLYTKA